MIHRYSHPILGNMTKKKKTKQKNRSAPPAFYVFISRSSPYPTVFKNIIAYYLHTLGASIFCASDVDYQIAPVTATLVTSIWGGPVVSRVVVLSLIMTFESPLPHTGTYVYNLSNKELMVVYIAATVYHDILWIISLLLINNKKICDFL